ncbi:MAG: O-antigen ligase family protein [Planctomycetes bacterium]|nr:O-antigen ligase family protein [Planctomycetota bacterium]
MTRPLALWLWFLLLLAASLLWYGGVSEAGLPVTAAAFAALYIASLLLLPEPARLTRGALIFLGLLAALFLIQLLPVAPLLFPYTAALRTTHGVGQLWPATADVFYTVRVAAQAATYVMAGLLVLRLRQSGVSTSQIIAGLLFVLLLEAGYGLLRLFARIDHVPFYAPALPPDSASGTLVNRNSFGGLMALGLVLAAVRAYGRFAWPLRGGSDPGRPRWMRRLEGGWGWALAAALFAVALMLSKSRGAVLAAVGGIALLPLLYRGRASVAGAAALLAVGGLAVFVANPAGLLERFGAMDPFDLSSESRWVIFTTTAQSAMKQPLFGFGWGTHPRAYHPFQPASLPGQVQHAHSEYVNVLFEAGFAGLLLLLAGLGGWFVRAWRAQKPLPGPDRMPVTAAIGAAAVIALHSFVDFDLRITSIGIVWAALLGLGSAASRDGTPRPTWPLPLAALLASAALFVLPLNPKSPEGEAAARCGLGLSPYDHKSAWALAEATQDPARLETAADLWPAHPDLQREAGLTFWERGDRSRAAKCLQRLFAQDPHAVAALMDEIWRKELPLAEYEALIPPSAGARTVYASSLVKRGLWKEGLEAFDRGVPADAAQAGWYDYFAAQLEAAGQWGLEASLRDRRLSLRSDAWAHGASARAWLKLGALERAQERAVTAARIDPANAEWPALRGAILEAKGDRVGAVEAYTAACALAPAELEWRLRRGLVELADKTYVAAAEDLRQVLRSRPQDRQAALGLARALAGQGQTSSAIIVLGDWIRSHPADLEAINLKGSMR